MKKYSTFILLFACILFIKSSPIFSADKLWVGVLGASGRTGVHIIDELKQRDVDIRAFSRRIKELMIQLLRVGSSQMSWMKKA